MTEVLKLSSAFRRTVAQDQRFNNVSFVTDHEWLGQGVAFLESCFPSAMLILCKINHPTMAYVSSNSEAVVGYKADYLMGLSAEAYFKLVHPDDATAVMRLYERMEGHMKSPTYRPDQWKFAFHYRLRTAEGEYVVVQDEKSAFYHVSDKFIHYSIMHRSLNPAVQSPFVIIRKRSGNTFRKIDTYTPFADRRSLTNREQEILQLLETGMTTLQISEALCVTPFTVRNHKQKMFRKMNVKTSLQAVNTARRFELLK